MNYFIQTKCNILVEIILNLYQTLLCTQSFYLVHNDEIKTAFSVLTVEITIVFWFQTNSLFLFFLQIPCYLYYINSHELTCKPSVIKITSEKVQPLIWFLIYRWKLGGYLAINSNVRLEFKLTFLPVDKKNVSFWALLPDRFHFIVLKLYLIFFQPNLSSEKTTCIRATIYKKL